MAETDATLELGTFSVCLAVSDLQASKRFYEKLGFKATIPDKKHPIWMVLKNGETDIGIFQGIFEKNTHCFNPGGKFDQPIPLETDIRTIHKKLKAAGIKTKEEGGLDKASGPAGFFVTDPDGKPILIEQHFWGNGPRVKSR